MVYILLTRKNNRRHMFFHDDGQEFKLERRFGLMLNVQETVTALYRYLRIQ